MTDIDAEMGFDWSPTLDQVATRRRRIDLQGVADLLGVKLRTAERYWRTDFKPGSKTPSFPEPDHDLMWEPDAIRAWDAARPGAGMPAGTERTQQECMRCGTPVRRRWRDPDTDELLCKPCYAAGGTGVAGGKSGPETAVR